MNPFPFEELQKILELNATELTTDEFIFNSTITYLERLLGYQLADKNYNELQTIRDCKIYTNQNHISEMINIIDMNTKLRVPNCVIDGRTIHFIDPKLEETEYEEKDRIIENEVYKISIEIKIHSNTQNKIIFLWRYLEAIQLIFNEEDSAYLYRIENMQGGKVYIRIEATV